MDDEVVLWTGEGPLLTLATALLMLLQYLLGEPDYLLFGTGSASGAASGSRSWSRRGRWTDR